jgi:hypothetical protein
MLKNLINYLKINNFFLVIFTILSIFFVNSVYWSLYNIDSQHFALVFLNAIEFNEGLILYKDIPEQYGILNTLISSYILKIFGNNLINIIILYNLVYSLSILIISVLFFKINSNKYFCILATILIILSNPVVQLPWGNYLSFFFLAIAVYFYFNEAKNRLILVGFFLSLCVLSRENNLYSCLAIVFIISVIEFIKNNNFRFFKKLLVSFLLPISLFFIFLFKNKIFYEWSFFSKELFNILSDHYTKDNQYFKHSFLNYFFLIKNFYNYFYISLFAHKNFRSLVFLFIFLINFYYILNFIISIFYKKNIPKNYNQIFLVFVSISQLTNALHITEAFRLATGFIFGTLLFAYLKFNFKILFFSFLTIFLVLISYSAGASYYPKHIFFNEKKKNIYTFDNGYFKDIKFNNQTQEFYENLKITCDEIIYKYKVKYYYNFTSNSFIGNYCGLKKKQTFQHFFQFYQNKDVEGFLSKDYFKNYSFDKKTVIFDFHNDLDDLNKRYQNYLFIKTFNVKEMQGHFSSGYLSIILPDKKSALNFDPFKTFHY